MHVLVVPNTVSPSAVEASRRLCERLVAAGHAVAMTEADITSAGSPDCRHWESDSAMPELAVALGGDGTILRAARLVRFSQECLILGVNMGRLGFLSGAEFDGLDAAVDAAIAGTLHEDIRRTVEAEVVLADGSTLSALALNDVWCGRGPAHRAVELRVSVDGHKVGQYYCDGVIAATPTGSTAHALSFGGPIVAPDVDAMIIVPAGAHTLAARPIVAGSDSTLTIELPNPARTDACVAMDGVTLVCGDIRSVDVRLSGVVRLLRPVNDFFDVVRDKLVEGSGA